MYKKALIILFTIMPTHSILSTPCTPWSDLIEQRNNIKNKKQQLEDLRSKHTTNHKLQLNTIKLHVEDRLQKDPQNIELILKKDMITQDLEFLDKQSEITKEMTNICDDMTATISRIAIVGSSVIGGLLILNLILLCNRN